MSQFLKDKKIKQKEKFEKELQEEIKSVPDIDKVILKSIFVNNKIDNEETYRNVKATYELGVDSLLSLAGVTLEIETVEMINEFLELLMQDYEQRNTLKDKHFANKN